MPKWSSSNPSSPVTDIDEGPESLLPATANVPSGRGKARRSKSGKRGSASRGLCRRKRTTWSAELQQKHLETLIECKYDGLQADGSMTKETYIRVRAVWVAMSGGANVDEEACRTRYYTTMY
jgi:hypothetical protein